MQNLPSWIGIFSSISNWRNFENIAFSTTFIFSTFSIFYSTFFNCDVLETWEDSIPFKSRGTCGRLKVVIGDNLLVYSEETSDNVTNRPKELPD